MPNRASLTFPAVRARLRGAARAAAIGLNPQPAHEAIRDRVEGYIALLRATSGLFAAVSKVDRDLFHA